MNEPKQSRSKPSSVQKDEDMNVVVNVKLFRQFYHLVAQGCPVCRKLGHESSYLEPELSVVGVVLKAKLYCSRNHKTSWNSSACAQKDKVFLTNSLVPVSAVMAGIKVCLNLLSRLHSHSSGHANSTFSGVIAN